MREVKRELTEGFDKTNKTENKWPIGPILGGKRGQNIKVPIMTYSYPTYLIFPSRISHSGHHNINLVLVVKKLLRIVASMSKWMVSRALKLHAWHPFLFFLEGASWKWLYFKPKKFNLTLVLLFSLPLLILVRQIATEEPSNPAAQKFRFLPPLWNHP